MDFQFIIMPVAAFVNAEDHFIWLRSKGVS